MQLRRPRGVAQLRRGGAHLGAGGRARRGGRRLGRGLAGEAAGGAALRRLGRCRQRRQRHAARAGLRHFSARRRRGALYCRPLRRFASLQRQHASLLSAPQAMPPRARRAAAAAPAAEEAPEAAAPRAKRGAPKRGAPAVDEGTAAAVATLRAGGALFAPPLPRRAQAAPTPRPSQRACAASCAASALTAAGKADSTGVRS